MVSTFVRSQLSPGSKKRVLNFQFPSLDARFWQNHRIREYPYDLEKSRNLLHTAGLYVEQILKMGNSQTKGKGTNKRRRLNVNGAVIQSCAVNVERDLAYSGKHLANLSVLDKVLHCAIKTKGASERQLSGAFLWYLCKSSVLKITSCILPSELILSILS